MLSARIRHFSEAGLESSECRRATERRDRFHRNERYGLLGPDRRLASRQVAGSPQSCGPVWLRERVE